MPPVAPRPASGRWRRWLRDLLLFVAALTAFQMWQLRDTPRGPAPEFHGQRTDGQAFQLADWRAEHAGRATLLYFWAEWCPICRTTAGNVSAIAQDHPVLSIATQSGEAAAIERFLADTGHRWPTLPDPDGSLMRRFGLPGTPAFAILAPDGEIRFVAMGYTSELGLRLRLWWVNRTAA